MGNQGFLAAYAGQRDPLAVHRQARFQFYCQFADLKRTPEWVELVPGHELKVFSQTPVYQLYLEGVAALLRALSAPSAPGFSGLPGQSAPQQINQAGWLQVQAETRHGVRTQVRDLKQLMLLAACAWLTGIASGLFGTVWGMFHPLATSTSPGQLALFLTPAVGWPWRATLLGLAFAFPAWRWRRHLQTAIAALEAELQTFAQQFFQDIKPLHVAEPALAPACQQPFALVIDPVNQPIRQPGSDWLECSYAGAK